MARNKRAQAVGKAGVVAFRFPNDIREFFDEYLVKNGMSNSQGVRALMYLAIARIKEEPLAMTAMRAARAEAELVSLRVFEGVLPDIKDLIQKEIKRNITQIIADEGDHDGG